MSLFIAPRPSQGSTALEFTTKFFENEDLGDLEDDVNAYLTPLNETSRPQGETFLADIQYQAEGDEDDERMNSVMIVLGTWNPA